MIPYILLVSAIFLITPLKKIKITTGVKITGFTAIFIIIFLFSALRFDVGYDYSMYYELIEGKIKFFEDQINRIEFFPRQIIFFSSFLGFYQLFFITTSILIYYYFYKSIKEHSLDRIVSVLIFTCFPIFFFMSLSVVRQYVGIAIVFYGYKFIKQRQFFKYLIAVLLAFFFHKSAILALPIYFLFGDFLINKKIIVFIYVLGFFSSEILAFLITLTSERYAIYINQIGGEGGNLILFFFQLIGLLLLPIVYNFRDNKDSEFNFYLITFYLGLFLWASLSKFGHAGIRGGLYYVVYIILLVPKLKNKIAQYKLLKQLLFIVCFLFFFINLYIGSKHKIKDANLPYQTYFFKNPKDFKPNE